MNQDKIFFERLVSFVSEDIRKENHKFYKLEKHLTDVNNTMTEKFSINELKGISICLRNSVKDILDHDEEYLCSGIPILAEMHEDPELFMYYTRGDYPLK